MHSTWAIGDIHGHAKHLELLLEKLPRQGGDHIVFLGDLIDRGPASKRVLDLVRQLSARNQVTYIRGNHEIMMLQARHHRRARMAWLRNGGGATLDAYAARSMDAIPDEDWQLMQSSVPFLETETAIYLHASFDPLLEMADQSEDDLFWRFCTDPAPHCSGKFVVCGHTTQPSGMPALWDRVICIDTLEPPQSDWLTALSLEKQAFFQINAAGETRFEPMSGLKV